MLASKGACKLPRKEHAIKVANKLASNSASKLARKKAS